MLLQHSRLAEDIKSQPHSLEQVLQHLHTKGSPAMLEAASLVRRTRRVLITGIGASLFASIGLECALCQQGIDASIVEAAELLHYRRNAHVEVTLLIVSRSGESVEIARLVESLQGRFPIIAITNEPDSTLGRTAEVSLNICSLPDEMVAIQTFTGTVLLQYVLAGAIANACEATLDEVASYLPAFGKLVHECMEALEKWDRFLHVRSPMFFLARGPSYSSASEGALLFNEIAKVPAVPMLVGSFRHGPVELVDGEFRGLIFAPAGVTQKLNLSLAQDLARFGGSLRVVGPEEATDAPLSWCPVPAVPEMLAPLFEIVPVQVAALRLAELRGITPGSFRYAPQVCRDEATFTTTDAKQAQP